MEFPEFQSIKRPVFEAWKKNYFNICDMQSAQPYCATELLVLSNYWSDSSFENRYQKFKFQSFQIKKDNLKSQRIRKVTVFESSAIFQFLVMPTKAPQWCAAGASLQIKFKKSKYIYVYLIT